MGIVVVPRPRQHHRRLEPPSRDLPLQEQQLLRPHALRAPGLRPGRGPPRLRDPGLAPPQVGRDLLRRGGRVLQGLPRRDAGRGGGGLRGGGGDGLRRRCLRELSPWREERGDRLQNERLPPSRHLENTGSGMQRGRRPKSPRPQSRGLRGAHSLPPQCLHPGRPRQGIQVLRQL